MCFVLFWDLLQKKLRFFVRLPNSECCETTIALELPSYPNNPNSSKGFSSHLSLIPAWQSTSSCSKQNWKADLKGCFEVRGLERRGGKAMKNWGYQTSSFNQPKGNKRGENSKVKQYLCFEFPVVPERIWNIPTPAVTSKKKRFLEAMHSDQQALG